MKQVFSRLFSILQQVGQSLMIPVSVLPAAGLLVAFGRILGDNSIVGKVLYSGGLAIFEQLPLVFAIGVAVGFAGQAGVAGLAAGAGYFTLVNILKVMSEVLHLELAINTGVFGGILVGLMSAMIYNRFHQIKFSPIFGFFAGKRFVPIMTVFCSFILGLTLALIWPPIQAGILAFGQSMLQSEWGPAFYAAGKRLLIPAGLHHVFYPPFLFQFGEFTTASGALVHGDSARYFAGDPTAGTFMASEFPIMLFGLPMAALAMVLAAKKDQRKAVAGVMLSAALTSIITGITEPIEFAFIFVAPLLYIVHVLLAFGSGVLTHFFDVHLGYTFSASLIDLGLGFFNQKNVLLLMTVIGPLIGIAYFTSFYGLIRWLNFATPGREAESSSTLPFVPQRKVEPGSPSVRPAQVLSALGSTANIESLSACITRLRVIVKNPELVNIAQLKSLGAVGVFVTGQNVQAVFGVESDQLKEQIHDVMLHGKQILWQPLRGKIVDLSQVPDETFASQVLGPGYAIDPIEGLVRAPADGRIVTIPPTKHAIGLKLHNGIEILIHVGLDTVKMQGQGFEILVKEGDLVSAHDPLLKFDLEAVRKNAKSTLTPVVITDANGEEFEWKFSSI